LIGTAQRAFEFACRRAESRVTFGRKLSEHQSVLEYIAKSFAKIEQARRLTMRAAERMGEVGPKEARDMMGAAKITVPQAVDRPLHADPRVAGSSRPGAIMCTWSGPPA
jgi:acyl-CoA dehydrogenase